MQFETQMTQSQTADPLALLTGELKNFQEIAHYIVPLPGEIPTLQGIDVYGGTMPLNGVIGGDHIIYLEFKKRYDLAARIEQAAAAGRSEVVANLERCKSNGGTSFQRRILLQLVIDAQNKGRW